MIERSLITDFKKSIYSRFIRAIKEFSLIEEGDKICVCISGGKDSVVLAKCFTELKKHGKNNFDVGFLVMDPGYNKENLKLIKENLKALEIKATFFKTDIFNSVYKMEGSPCYMCARMRRGALYNKAKELGYNKIALGHHMDDVVETTLMNMFYNGHIKTMKPKLKSLNFEGMELIRPMFYIEEEDIKKFWENAEAKFLQCACRFTEGEMEDKIEAVWTDADIGKRLETKLLIKEIKKKNKHVKLNILSVVLEENSKENNQD